MMPRLSLLLAVVFCTAASAQPSKPIVLGPDEGAREGKALAQEMASMRPGQNTTSTGTLSVKRPRTEEVSIPVRFAVQIGETNWLSVYEAPGVTNGVSALTVVHDDGQPNRYEIVKNGKTNLVSANQTMIPFAGTDFWIIDLGLEFLSWPQQRILRKEIRRGQSCSVLESTNPNPAPGTYAKVISWVDIDTGGIINADAYGRDGKPLKEFVAQKFKKVRGQWEVKQIEMNDRRSGSRTTLTFDLDVR